MPKLCLYDTLAPKSSTSTSGLCIHTDHNTLQGSKTMFFLYFLIFNSEQNVHSLVWKQVNVDFPPRHWQKQLFIWTKNTLLSWATHKGTSNIIKIISSLTPQHSGTWMKWAVINAWCQSTQIKKRVSDRVDSVVSLLNSECLFALGKIQGITEWIRCNSTTNLKKIFKETPIQHREFNRLLVSSSPYGSTERL